MSEAIRRDAVTCALAGIAAVDPGDLVRDALTRQHFEGGVALVAVGKAAGPMAASATAALADTIRQGVVIAPDAVSISNPRIATFIGGHPTPNEAGARGAQEIGRLVEGLRVAETLLCLVSGGASSLMTLPPHGISIEDVASATGMLMRAGATIHELNCVRKHIDRLKGGRLAALAFPANVTALILSDVVGDSLDTIASGPTVADPTSIADAIKVLRTRGVWNSIAPAIRSHLERGDDESPKPGDSRLARCDNRIIGSNVTAATAACDQARKMGYAARVVTTALTGEASDIGADIARQLLEERNRVGRKVALIFAGEPTVTVKGTGTGGRNQELALGAAIALNGVAGCAVASLGTDGVDGPTDSAGAVADGESLARGRAIGLDPSSFLAANDSHAFWKALGGLVRTGPTGTNVMDIVVALAVPQPATT